MEENGEESAAPGTENDKCYWHKSQSIVKESKIWYTACHKLCTGVDANCEKYISKSQLEKKLNEETL